MASETLSDNPSHIKGQAMYSVEITTKNGAKVKTVAPTDEAVGRLGTEFMVQQHQRMDFRDQETGCLVAIMASRTTVGLDPVIVSVARPPVKSTAKSAEH